MKGSFFFRNPLCKSKLKKCVSFTIISIEAVCFLSFSTSAPALPQMNTYVAVETSQPRESSTFYNPVDEKKQDISAVQTNQPVLGAAEERASIPAMPTVTQEVYKSSATVIKYPVSHVGKGKGAVALTFDDGYDRKSIERVLEILKNNKVKCTFFVIGQALQTNAELWKQAVLDGHQICNHTYSHRFLRNITGQEIRKELEGWERTASEILGGDYLKRMKREFPFVRLPGGIGSSDEEVLKVIAEKDYIPVGWSVETVYGVLRHYNLHSTPVELLAEKIASYVPENTQEGAIVLLHFVPYDTVKLEYILQGFKEKGLEVKTISELLK